MNFYAASVALLWTTAMRMANPPREARHEWDQTDRPKHIDHLARHGTLARSSRRFDHRSASRA